MNIRQYPGTFTNGHQIALECIPMQEIAVEQQIKAYNDLLKLSKLRLEHELSYRNVKIFENDHLHQIYTIPEKPNLPHIVMLHGYGGYAKKFFKTFQYLQPHFQVHALDTFGIGFSSLGNYDENFTQDQTKLYYVDPLEQWRKKHGIQSFTLVGHSFGGYISIMYAQRYPQRISRLILQSPAGTTHKDQNQQESQLSDSFLSQVKNYVGKKIYDLHIKPSDYLLINPLPCVNIVTANVGTRLKGRQKHANKKFLTQLALNAKGKNNSESGFYKLFSKYLVRPRISIQQVIDKNKFKFDIEFYFGSKDWMDKEGAERLTKRHDNVFLEIIEDSGHLLNYDNSRQVCAKILTTARERQKTQHIVYSTKNKLNR